MRAWPGPGVAVLSGLLSGALAVALVACAPAETPSPAADPVAPDTPAVGDTATPTGITYDMWHKGGLTLGAAPRLPESGDPGAEVELTGRWSGAVAVAGADSVVCGPDPDTGSWTYTVTTAGSGDFVVVVALNDHPVAGDPEQPPAVGVVAFTDDTGQFVTYPASGEGEVSVVERADRGAVAFSLLISGGLGVVGVIRCPATAEGD